MDLFGIHYCIDDEELCWLEEELEPLDDELCWLEELLEADDSLDDELCPLDDEEELCPLDDEEELLDQISSSGSIISPENVNSSQSGSVAVAWYS